MLHIKIYKLSKSTYYKCSNINEGSTEKELIKIFEHKVYTLYIKLLVITPDDQISSSDLLRYCLESNSLSCQYCSIKLYFYIPTDQFSHLELISVEIASLEDLAGDD